MLRFTDQLGREVRLAHPPQRIVSVVPSQTELLADLGLDDQVLGITKFCIHPEAWFRSKTRVGGTKTLHLDRIRALRPDLVIANKEENTREQIEALEQEFPVWISDIQNLEQALDMIRRLSVLCSREEAGIQLVSDLENRLVFPAATSATATCLYFIWKSPWMSVNKHTFIHDMLQRLGFTNVCANHPSRYPEISEAEMREFAPDFVFLSSEPYPFKAAHIAWFQEHLPNSRIMLVDGEAFSWYGSRLLKTADYLHQISALAKA